MGDINLLSPPELCFYMLLQGDAPHCAECDLKASSVQLERASWSLNRSPLLHLWPSSFPMLAEADSP